MFWKEILPYNFLNFDFQCFINELLKHCLKMLRSCAKTYKGDTVSQKKFPFFKISLFYMWKTIQILWTSLNNVLWRRTSCHPYNVEYSIWLMSIFEQKLCHSWNNMSVTILCQPIKSLGLVLSCEFTIQFSIKNHKEFPFHSCTSKTSNQLITWSYSFVNHNLKPCSTKSCPCEVLPGGRGGYISPCPQNCDMQVCKTSLSEGSVSQDETETEELWSQVAIPIPRLYNLTLNRQDRYQDKWYTVSWFETQTKFGLKRQNWELYWD